MDVTDTSFPKITFRCVSYHFVHSCLISHVCLILRWLITRLHVLRCILVGWFMNTIRLPIYVLYTLLHIFGLRISSDAVVAFAIPRLLCLVSLIFSPLVVYLRFPSYILQILHHTTTSPHSPCFLTTDFTFTHIWLLLFDCSQLLFWFAHFHIVVATVSPHLFLIAHYGYHGWLFCAPHLTPILFGYDFTPLITHTFTISYRWTILPYTHIYILRSQCYGAPFIRLFGYPLCRTILSRYIADLRSGCCLLRLPLI